MPLLVDIGVGALLLVSAAFIGLVVVKLFKEVTKEKK